MQLKASQRCREGRDEHVGFKAPFIFFFRGGSDDFHHVLGTDTHGRNFKGFVIQDPEQMSRLRDAMGHRFILTFAKFAP